MWDMCQMLNIWQISHTKHKKQLPSDVAYMPKLYHLYLYCCKFATVRTNVVKRNNVLYLAFSLLSLLVLISSLSLLTSDPASLNRKRTKWHSHQIRGEADHLHGWGHSDRIIAIVIVIGGASGMGEATPIIHIHIVITIVIAASILSISLSLSFGGWLFWLLVVGWFWLMVVGWSGFWCEIWVDIGVWVWVDWVGWFWLIGFWL